MAYIDAHLYPEPDFEALSYFEEKCITCNRAYDDHLLSVPLDYDKQDAYEQREWEAGKAERYEEWQLTKKIPKLKRSKPFFDFFYLLTLTTVPNANPLEYLPRFNAIIKRLDVVKYAWELTPTGLPHCHIVFLGKKAGISKNDYSAKKSPTKGWQWFIDLRQKFDKNAFENAMKYLDKDDRESGILEWCKTNKIPRKYIK